MRRIVLLCGVASLVMAFMGTILAHTLAVPALVDAQQTLFRGEQVTVVGGNAAERIRLSTGPGVSAGLTVLEPDGAHPVVTVATGGAVRVGGAAPDAAELIVSAADGTQLVDLGTTRGPLGDRPLSAHLLLRDSQGRDRVRLQIGEDGTPSMQFLDAAGNVTWSAR